MTINAGEEEYFRDEWPKMPDGSDYDGKGFLALLQSGQSPFSNDWDANLLIKEIEEATGLKVLDIPNVYYGANNLGFVFSMSNGKDIVARFDRADANKITEDKERAHKFTVDEMQFMKEVYELL